MYQVGVSPSVLWTRPMVCTERKYSSSKRPENIRRQCSDCAALAWVTRAGVLNIAASSGTARTFP
jgi:hypothetical protein